MNKTFRNVALAVVAAFAVAAAVGSPSVSAQNGNTNQSAPPFMGHGGRGGPGGPMGMGMLPMLPRELGLTDAQRDQIRAIGQTHSDEWKALMTRSRTAHTALDAAITADTVDEGTIRQDSAAVAAVDADMAVARAQAHAEVMQLLTADQKTKLKELRAQFNARRQSPRGQQ